MKIAIEATEKMVNIDGVECRLWEGFTECGIRCKVFVYRITMYSAEDCTNEILNKSCSLFDPKSPRVWGFSRPVKPDH